MLRLSIPQPCHELWDQMTPTYNGAFCSSCQKTVIDFSQMSDAAIIQFWQEKKEGPVCGRFKKSQLNRTLDIISPEVLYMDIPAWKKYLAVLFICFSGLITGCKNNVADDRVYPLPPPVVITENKLAGASTFLRVPEEIKSENSEETNCKKEDLPFNFNSVETMISGMINEPPVETKVAFHSTIIEELFGHKK